LQHISNKHLENNKFIEVDVTHSKYVYYHKKILKFLITKDVQERERNKVDAGGIGNDFLSRSQVAHQLRKKYQQMGLHEI
jgi:hypothetical protein